VQKIVMKFRDITTKIEYQYNFWRINRTIFHC